MIIITISMFAKYKSIRRKKSRKSLLSFSSLSGWTATLVIVLSPVITVFNAPVTYADTLGDITTYHTGSVHPYGIVQGQDGNLWYTLESSDKIGKMSTSGTKTEYSLPSSASDPDHIALGPNGNPWFTMTAAKVGEVDYSGNITIHSLTLGTDNGATSGLATGSDGNLWIGDNANTGLGGYVHTMDDQGNDLARYFVAGYIVGITSDPAHNQIWYAARQKDSSGAYTGHQLIGKINENGTASAPYVAPSGVGNMFGISIGPDGNVWFAAGNDKVGYVDNSGNYTVFTLPVSSSGIWQIKQGLDGYMWATLYNSSKLVRIPLNGVGMTTYTLAGSYQPLGLTPGIDGNMWFTEYGNYAIGKIGTGVSGSSIDQDGDGLNFGQELAQGTSDNDSDTDNDGLSDYVESSVYPNRAVTFCNAAGTVCSYPHPLRKDVYVETDWMADSTGSYQPNSTIASALSNAYNAHGISLHIDYGQYGGGNEVPYSSSLTFSPTPGSIDFEDYKYGGDGISSNFDYANRLGIWHYMVLGDTFSEYPSSSGVAQDGSDDAFISYGLIRDNQSSFGYSSLETAIEGTIIHELGHNNCLTQSQAYTVQNVSACVYSGIDTVASTNYNSAMNYRYQMSLVDYSTGQNGTINDHNDWYAVKLHLNDFTINTDFPDSPHGVAVLGIISQKTHTIKKQTTLSIGVNINEAKKLHRQTR